MKHFQTAFVAAVCTIIIAGGSALHAQAQVFYPKHQHPVRQERKVTPQEKSASDQAMKTGLSQLQAAASAMQSNNAQGVGNNLIAARNTMTQALPIYDGHRERAIQATEEALKEMRGTGTEAGKRVATHLAAAIQDAQAAIQKN